MQKTQIIILAAGHGTRMQHELPKPLVPLCGKPMIQYLLDAIAESGVCDDPIIVVSPTNIDVFMEMLGEDHRYTLQDKQLGTGHATMVAREALIGDENPIMVLYGDMPFVSTETIRAISERANETKATLTMATTVLSDFDDWRNAFYGFSRVLRDEEGKLLRTVEKKDATDEQLLVTEVNPAYLCFQSDWLWSHLSLLKNDNAQEEYYLTDLIRMAVEEGDDVATVQIDPKEALGINTPEHLKMCEEVVKARN